MTSWYISLRWPCTSGRLIDMPPKGWYWWPGSTTGASGKPSALAMKLIWPAQHRACRRLRLQTHNIHSEAIGSLVEPPVHHVKHRFPQLWVLPVQVWLVSPGT